MVLNDLNNQEETPAVLNMNDIQHAYVRLLNKNEIQSLTILDTSHT
jgi:hypothetical protein